jgi:hypothetical protein
MANMWNKLQKEYISRVAALGKNIVMKSSSRRRRIERKAETKIVLDCRNGQARRKGASGMKGILGEIKCMLHWRQRAFPHPSGNTNVLAV